MKYPKSTFLTAPLIVLSSVTMVQGQPVWTDILNQPGTGTIASGNYYDAGSNTQGPIYNTYLGGILPQANTLSIAANITYLDGAGDQGGPVNCGNNSSNPVAFIESDYGTGIKGVGFLGSFNTPGPLNNLSGNLFEAVFFNDTYCYNGGREYGFFLATYDNSIWVYWGANENLPNVVQAQIQLPGVQSNHDYYYEIYPVASGPSGCSFQVTVLETNFTPVINQTYDVNSNNYPAGSSITGADSGFCGSVASAPGYFGYVSANIEPAGNVSGALPSSGLNLTMSRVFVGK